MARRAGQQVEEEVALEGLLAEFRTALREEIETARRTASSRAVHLINGHRVAKIGAAYQYVFALENALNVPGDAPGDLLVPGHGKTEVTIISVDGMRITLSTPVDLGPNVPSAQLQSDLVFLMRKLIERIEALADRKNPVGERALGISAPVGEVVPLQLADPNTKQSEAVASSLGRNITFVWGPPGTGKTRTIGWIAEQLYRRGRSVLLVSHTNTAVDQALLRIGKLLESNVLSEGHIVRVGEPRDARLVDENHELRLDTHVERRSSEFVRQKEDLQGERASAVERVCELTHRIDICEWVAVAPDDIKSMNSEWEGVLHLDAQIEQIRLKEQRLESLADAGAESVRAATEASVWLREAGEEKKRLLALRGLAEKQRTALDNASALLVEAEGLYERTVKTNRLVRFWRGLPSPEQQGAVVWRLKTNRNSVAEQQGQLQSNMQTSEGRRSDLLALLEGFRRQYRGEPDEVIGRETERQAKHSETKARREKLTAESRRCRATAADKIRIRFGVLREWQLISQSADSEEKMLREIGRAFETALEQAKGLELHELRSEQASLNGRIREIDTRIAEIEDILRRIEEIVIAEAMVVATTLTRAYLRDSIQARRFDTVILDEASMAPIPALWVAASLAEANAVVVGDFRQLPPIVLSSHEMAQKWLGRDIFKVAGLTQPDTTPGHFVSLNVQYRMHPAISAIPNALVYGHLSDDPKETQDDSNLSDWYRVDWGHDQPVLLVDMAPTDAWVTSIPRGRRASRLNFLSASVCVDLAEQLLAPNRLEFDSADAPRVIIVCPYRAHAQLLELLLRHQGIAGEVAAGTAHSFQGSEATVVILDLVNDEPHWKVGMFMPRNDEANKRLLNVAVTRARRRLIIVGDFKYIKKNAKRAFLGSELIPFLEENYAAVSALDIVKGSLAARAAKAQIATCGGEVVPVAERMITTNSGQFYSLLLMDLANVRDQVIIYSPFIASERLSYLQPALRAASGRGVRVYIVTKTLQERGQRRLSEYRKLEKSLSDWGMIVIHKRRMHEKLAFIDKDIIWTGSLNILSFRDTEEYMERRQSKQVFQDYARELRLDDLLGEFANGAPRCPICDSEMVASEGRDDPFFWRCVVDGCYTRSIDQPRLEGGVITCYNCGGQVEYGEWGKCPSWRCVENRHHHQRIARTHLLLPEMAARIPRRALRRLQKQFGISIRRPEDEKPRDSAQGQSRLS